LYFKYRRPSSESRFILTENGWILSPAYDLNPSVEKDGLALNIDMDDNALNLELAKSVGLFSIKRF
jgi:serine/threonine-protein kinase HipA